MATGAHIAGAADSGTPGPKGNREVFVLAHGPQLPDPGIDWQAAIEAAVAEGTA